MPCCHSLMTMAPVRAANPYQLWDFKELVWLITKTDSCLNQHKLTWPIDFSNIRDDIKHIQNSLTFPILTVSSGLNSQYFCLVCTWAARSCKASLLCSWQRLQTSSLQVRERKGVLWRTWSVASCGEPCMLLLLMLFTQTRLSCLSTRMQHWPKGWLLIWHGKNMGLNWM